MIKIENEKLIIEVSHPCPKEYAQDLQEAIFGIMHSQDPKVYDAEKNHFITCTLLELLKNLK